MSFVYCLSPEKGSKYHLETVQTIFSEKFRKCFILFPAFNLIMWLIKLPKNFGKIVILKIGELVSFCEVKTYFGKK